MISKMESCGFSIKKTKVDLAELTRLQLAELNELFERTGKKKRFMQSGLRMRL